MKKRTIIVLIVAMLLFLMSISGEYAIGDEAEEEIQFDYTYEYPAGGDVEIVSEDSNDADDDDDQENDSDSGEEESEAGIDWGDDIADDEDDPSESETDDEQAIADETETQEDETEENGNEGETAVEEAPVEESESPEETGEIAESEDIIDEEPEDMMEEGPEERKTEKDSGKKPARNTTIAPSQNTRKMLVADWEMTEARKVGFDDVIRFPFRIVSIDNSGTVALEWGGSGRIKGQWDELRQVLTIFGNQKYVLHDGVLGGANGSYSGAAVRTDVVPTRSEDSVIGTWQMTEYRKDVNNDILQFDVEIIAIDDSGNVALKWSGDEINGKWDDTKKTLTVYDRQVYVLNNGILGGGNETYSGIALRKAY